MQSRSTSKIIGLIGGPSAGKSSVAAELFAKMKRSGYDVELCREFAKDLVYSDPKQLKYQEYIYGEQKKRQQVLIDYGVKYIVTDCPTLLSAYYNYETTTEAFKQAVIQDFKKQDAKIYFLYGSTYRPSGRVHTEEESKRVSSEIETMLLTNCIPYTRLYVADAASDILSYLPPVE